MTYVFYDIFSDQLIVGPKFLRLLIVSSDTDRTLYIPLGKL